MRKLIFVLFLSFILNSAFESYKLYVIRSHVGNITMMNKIEKSIKAEHFIIENFAYKSISVDIDSIGLQLYMNTKKSGFDIVSLLLIRSVNWWFAQ